MATYKWHANAEVLRVVDGDTFRARLDLGWRVFIESDIRLACLNAAELHTRAGNAAGANLKTILPAGLRVLIISTRIDKYGRAVAFVQMPDGSDLGAALVASGFAAGADSSLNPAPYLGPPPLDATRAMGTQPAEENAQRE